MCSSWHSFKMVLLILQGSSMTEHCLSPLCGEQVIWSGYHFSCEATEIRGLFITMA